VEKKEWIEEMEKKPKLRTYRTFKSILELEPYLVSEDNIAGRKLLTALRSGTNSLRIETGRWKKPKEPETERLCMACMNGDIEDERHFLVACSAYDQLRKNLFHEIAVASSGTWRMESMSPEAKFLWLMGGTKDRYQEPIFDFVKHFIRKAHKRRNQL
jgi:hypothetical protein